ncbi:MAG: DUF1697 domain-containing protein [Planctomycetota bacterium]
MGRFVAFLRGMNLGGRRITNDDLCAAVAGIGFDNVSAFQASGNVLLETTLRAETKITKQLEAGLEAALDYPVPTFVRSAAQVEAIAAADPFGAHKTSHGGKLQVAMLRVEPTPAQQKAALACATKDDQLAIIDRELYWLPIGKITDSELDMKSIDKALGEMTVRTHGTIERLHKRLSG